MIENPPTPHPKKKPFGCSTALSFNELSKKFGVDHAKFYLQVQVVVVVNPEKMRFGYEYIQMWFI